jgi:hypothetical protein
MWGFDMKGQIIIPPTVVLLLTGCATKNWAEGPNVNRQLTKEQVEANCRMMARHGGTGFAAAGSPGFVAGAAIGNGVGNAAIAAQDFDDCSYLKAVAAQ